MSGGFCEAFVLSTEALEDDKCTQLLIGKSHDAGVDSVAACCGMIQTLESMRLASCQGFQGLEVFTLRVLLQSEQMRKVLTQQADAVRVTPATSSF